LKALSVRAFFVTIVAQMKQITFMKAFGIATEFGFIVAVPLVSLGFLGKYLDQRLDTKAFLLLGILLALTSSTLWLYKRIKSLLQDLRSSK
jgi:hypothetical protein